MTVLLQVIGENIFSKDNFKYKPKKLSRKVFNSDWSCVAEYQHEIANHFRDYKNIKNKNRNFKRRRNNNKVIFEEQPCVYRDVLPLNQLNFPQCNSVIYQEQFKNCYDTTLQKISTTNSLRELKLLTKRQERLCKHKKGSNSTHGTFNNCSNYLFSYAKTRYNIKSEKRNNLGHISFDETNSSHYLDIGDNKVIWEGVSVNNRTKEEFSNDNDNYFFLLASECYDEGFLFHIRYLKSIVDRNTKNNQISNPRKLNYNTDIKKPNSHPPSVVSSASSNYSTEDLPNSVVGVGKFASVVKRLLQNHNFKHNPCNKTQRDLKICVNITRSISLESLKSPKKVQDFATGNHCIMSDILNTTEGEPKEIVFTNSETVKRQHFHDLIENLNNLEISDPGSLPKIVLTDFSTITSADDSTDKTLCVSESYDKTIRKQESLEIDVPFFNDYNSEARPP